MGTFVIIWIIGIIIVHTKLNYHPKTFSYYFGSSHEEENQYCDEKNCCAPREELKMDQAPRN